MANIWGSLMIGINAGVTAFREAFTKSDIDSAPTFNSYAARAARYALAWAYFENNAYSTVNSWATKYKADYGLYKYTRGVYNPTARLAQFWRAHLLGGPLDPAAGDGESKPSALPIITDNDALRPALAELWRASNWGTRKDLMTLYGVLFGEVGLKVIDDTARGKVYLSVVHPATIYDITLDDFGNVKGYTLMERRRAPGSPDTYVTYGETATRDGDAVVYETTLDGAPYAWDVATGASWRANYGFVPFVLLRHDDVGLDWGWSEIHPALTKFREADDLASKISDMIRKTVDPKYFFTGVPAPNTTPRIGGATATVGAPQPGREELPALYAPAGATATPLVAPLDLAGALQALDGVLKEIERDYPELKADELRLSGTLSGRALELAQQPAADKVVMRRAVYDGALVKAQQMAISIGGVRRYNGYAGFGLDSFTRGTSSHEIGPRAVFNRTRADELDEQKTLWETAALAVGASYPLEAFLRDNGWDDARLAEMGTQKMAAIQLMQEDSIPAEPL